MTKEEAIEEVKAAFDAWEYQYDTGEDWSKAHEAKDMAIKALEQQPCEDAISRQAAIDIVNNPLNIRLDEIIKKLPSVTPQYNDAEIQKMQELEQAEIKKAYELGKAEQLKIGRWIKKRVEGRGIHYGYCSNCDYNVERRYDSNYCPNCGAKMEEVTKEEEFDNLEGMLEDLWNATVEDHRKYSEDMESEGKNE